MTTLREESNLRTPHYGWQVTLAGLGINLALGILYTWSVLSKGVPDEWGWSHSDRSWPYAVACLVFCLVMVPAGRMQDKMGPRIVATLGGVLVGVGMLFASLSTTPLGYVIGFGVLAGAGIGFGYASATPPAVKWFPAAQTGMISGIVVSGFGLAAVYAAPLSQWLIAAYGLPTAAGILGIAFLVIVVGLAQLLRAPSPDYVPPGAATINTPSASAKTAKVIDYAPSEMLRTWQFYVLWFTYACGAGAGLMIISKLAVIGSDQLSISLGFMLVAALAVGNGAGRIVAGLASDRLGRMPTLITCFAMQATLIVLLSATNADSPLASPVALALVSALIGACYGANLTLFPSLTKDYYGLKNFGVNYGLVFTAWGVGGFLLSLLAGRVYDQQGTLTFAYYCSAGMLIAAAAVCFTLRPPQSAQASWGAALRLGRKLKTAGS